jgi:hypothetical protein
MAITDEVCSCGSTGTWGVDKRLEPSGYPTQR